MFPARWKHAVSLKWPQTLFIFSGLFIPTQGCFMPALLEAPAVQKPGTGYLTVIKDIFAGTCGMATQ